MTERDRKLRLLRRIVRQVVKELDDSDLAYISNSRHGLLVELVERSRDRLARALRGDGIES